MEKFFAKNPFTGEFVPVSRVDQACIELLPEKPTHAEQICARGFDLADASTSLSFLDNVVKPMIKEYDEYVKGDPRFMPTRDMVDASRYMTMDIEATQKLYAKVQKERNKTIYDSMIQRVIFNPPATIVFWRDGSKTVVKCGENDIFDPEKGLAMAISKRAFGDNRDYYEVFAKWVGKYEYQQKRKEKK